MVGSSPASVTLVVLTPAEIDAFVTLHDRACFGGCYCAVWTELGPDWGERCRARTPNRVSTMERVQRGEHVGFLVLEEGEVVGWTGAGPRLSFPRLHERKGARRFPNDPSDWILGCFALAPEHRGRGLAHRIVEAVLEHARSAGASGVDAFPVRPWDEPRAYRGAESLYAAHGFEVVGSEPDDQSEVLVMRRRL